ncbi:proteasome subunit beta [Propionicicella superfundia]|uniref:proteasome subunit beta n=1 Tax=Propionicicella superfundia TaxID=348582 RepID=UPI0004176272|nr:proteasome subunit beta [Propionicicella superfundia]
MAWSSTGWGRPGREPDAGATAARASFVDYLRAVAPEALPHPGGADLAMPHGTTIVAAVHADGVVMAADRRATVGNLVAQRDIRKVFAADDHCLVGIAGAAGVAAEVARLLQVELVHYEKVEGSPLSLDGKANRLGGMIRGNLDLAMQGLIALPVMAGYDLATGGGRIFSYDAAGGRYEETGFFSVGSGAPFARGALKKLYRPAMSEDDAVVALIQALVDSADDDTATAGPDPYRRIYPSVSSASAAGIRVWDDDELAPRVDAVLAGRRDRPDGPEAPLL